MKAIRLLSAAAAAACLTFTACSDYVGKEDSHPLYAKYESAKNKKAYEEAADNLEEFLTICPKSPKAHYDVAMVYKENLRNYPFAIYHLKKYLDLSGETISKEDAAAIQGYMQDCKRLMATDAAVAATPQSNAALIAAQQENETLKARIGTLEKNTANVTLLERKLSAQKQQYNELVKQYNALTKEFGSQTQSRQSNAASSATRGTTTSTPSAPRTATSSSIPSAPRTTTTTPSAPRAAASTSIPKDGVPGSVIEGENGVRYYYVDRGEGWEKVSQKMYGNRTMTKLIQDANSGVTTLQMGKMIVIPPAPKQ